MKYLIAQVFVCVLVGASARSLRSDIHTSPQLITFGSSTINASDLEKLVVHMVNSQAGGSVHDDLIAIVQAEIVKMDGQVHQEAAAAQTGLDALHGAFESCSKLVIQAGNKDVINAQEQHYTCRVKEGEAETEHSACAADLALKKSMKESVCQVYDSLNVPPADKLGSIPGGAGKSQSDWLGEVIKWATTAKTQLDQAKAHCDKATLSYNTKLVECQGLETKWTQQKTACYKKQVGLDVATCTHAGEAMQDCEKEVACYDQAKDAWDAQLPPVQEEEASRNHEWWMIQRIGCFLSVFAKAAGDNKVDEAHLQECKSKMHSGLDLVYPVVPARPKKKCVGPPEPCSVQYIKHAYKDLPANAPANECTPCSTDGGSTDGGSTDAASTDGGSTDGGGSIGGGAKIAGDSKLLTGGTYTKTAQTGWGRPASELKPGSTYGLVGHWWKKLGVRVDFGVRTRLDKIVNHFGNSVAVSEAESEEGPWTLVATVPPKAELVVSLEAQYIDLFWERTDRATNQNGQRLEFWGAQGP